MKIEPYYQAQAKQLVDHLFDKGYFSDTLSRDGMDDVEGLIALYLQLGAESSARCAAMSKKFKQRSKADGGENPERQENEMRWIGRAREAEARVRKLEQLLDRISGWTLEVGAFLKKTLSFPFCFEMGEASRLFTTAIEQGIIPEPDCKPGKTWEVRPPDGCACPPPIGT